MATRTGHVGWCCGIGGLVARVLHAQEPNGVGTLVRSGVAVEQISDGFVKVALPVFCGREQWIRFALG